MSPDNSMPIGLEHRAGSYPNRAYATYVVGVLMLVGFMVFLDRQILTLLVVPIRQELRISDVQMSLLQGLAFVALYSFAGVPIGWFADRLSRRNILLAGFLFWTLMTLLCGVASDFAGLFAARLALGLGAAAYDPTAFSMVADYFPPASRSRAMAAVAVGLALGAGGSLIIGGVAIGHISAATSITLPLLGTLRSWHLVFLIIAVPGFVIAPLLLTVREPVRHEMAHAAHALAPGAARPKLFATLNSQGATFLCVYGSYAMIAFAAYAVSVWAPTLLMRQYGIAARSAGLIVGASAGVFGVVGAMASGFIGDAWAATGRLDGRFRVNLIACPILIAGLVATVLAPALWLSAAGLCLVMLGGGIGLTGAYSAVPELVPNQLRGQAIAIFSLTANLVGLGLGPTAVAAVTVYLLRDDALIGTSILVACVPAVVVALALSLVGLRPYRLTRARILAVVS